MEFVNPRSGFGFYGSGSTIWIWILWIWILFFNCSKRQTSAIRSSRQTLPPLSRSLPFSSHPPAHAHTHHYHHRHDRLHTPSRAPFTSACPVRQPSLTGCTTASAAPTLPPWAGPAACLRRRWSSASCQSSSSKVRPYTTAAATAVPGGAGSYTPSPSVKGQGEGLPKSQDAILCWCPLTLCPFPLCYCACAYSHSPN